MPSSGKLSPQESRHLADQISRSQAPVVMPPAPGEALAAPVIDVWFGLDQTFGQLGTPQNWVNILGNVTADDGLTSLEYSLNGGPQLPLSIGPDDRRLAEPGDFNVDLSISDLLEGENLVVITATDDLSVQTTETVTVNYSGLNVWPLPYSVDWDTVTDIQDVVQITDGKWEVLAGGLRTTQIDYDRVVDFGDLAWDNYEITTTVTLHGTEEPGPLSGSTPGMGFTSRWPGHSDSPASAAGYQPKAGWLPSGAACFYSVATSNIGIDGQLDSSVAIGIGDTVNWKFRVETPPGFMGRYSVKIWPLGQPEPDNWNIIMIRSSDETNGSLLFYAHHADVTLGDVQIIEIPFSISNVQVLHTSSTTAEVSWSTDAPSTSRVDYGLDSAYGLFETDANLVTEHSVTLTGLSADTEYHFLVSSTDAGSFEAYDEDRVFDTTPSILVSDDFNSCELNDVLWTATDPLNDAIISVDGTRAHITAPGSESTGHSAWGTGPGDFANTLPRLMQTASDTDFQIEIKFESGLDTEFQDQGVLIEQDSNDLMLVEFTRNANNDTRVRALKIVDGAGSNMGDWGIPIAPSGTAPLFLRINRTGDIWTISYSLDGVAWSVYKIVEHIMAVSAVGVFAGNGGNPVPEVTASIDYFFNATSPIVPEDPIVLAAPVLAPIGDRTMEPEESLTINLSATDDDLDPITLSEAGLPSFATFADFGDGTGEIVLNPGPADVGDFEITVTATDSPCGLFDFETFTVHIGTVIPSIIVSDDFNACSLNTGLWTTFDPDGDTTFRVNGYQAEISVPAGTTHDVWGTGPGDFDDNLPRLMQPANDVDFEIEARYESALTTSFQSQGLIIEEDANDFLRFELGVNTSGQTTIALYKFVDGAGSNIGGWGTPIAPAGTFPLRLKALRVGADWTMSYSIDDGANWVTYQAITHVMAVSAVGVHCGNGGSAQPAHTATIDYFFNTVSPIDPEDPVAYNAPVLALIGDQSMEPEASLTLNLSASDDNSDPITLTETGLPSFATFADFGDGTGEIVLDPGPGDVGDYEITVTATDSPCGLFDSETFTVHVGTIVIANIESDDFNCHQLDTDLWTFVNPLSDATISLNGTQALVSLPEGGAIHDLWGTGPDSFSDTMVRLMQATTDSIFEIEARFESGFSESWQTQGIIVAQDENDLLRMEFNYSGGGDTEIAIFKVEDGAASNIGGWGTPITPVGTSPLLLKVSCQIDQWTVSYSIDDGSNWFVYQTFTHVMAVSSAGLHFGNSGDPVPALTSVVDYFFNTASPIDPEDGLTFNSPELDMISDTAVTELQTLNIPISATDPDGDPIILSTAGLPAFGTLTDNGDGTGFLEFMPQVGDFGFYPIQVFASDPCAAPDMVAFTLTVNSASAGPIVSDDFNSCTLNTALWNWTDPVGDTAQMVSGAQLLISLPADVSHAVSGTGVGDFANNTARLTQPIAAGDFGLEVGFESSLTQVGQSQGVLIQQDNDDLLVVDFVSLAADQTSLRTRTFVGGSATEIGLTSLGAIGFAPLALRVDRTGSDWAINYSIDDGTNWLPFQNFTHTMGIALVGVMAGNDGSPAPAHHVVVDYFFNQAAPISPEDATPCAVPSGITDLVASPVMTGNDGDGTIKIDLSWTAASCALAVDIYRKPYDDYPIYGNGSVPATPVDPAQALAEGWELAASVPATLTGFQDEPSPRDYWYYVAMVRNGCGDASPTSNQPEGVLNYFLGDVFDDAIPGQGNNVVGVEDITLLGGSYGVDSNHGSYYDFLDIGPTVTGSVTARPQPDNQIEFEDLMMVSINYGVGAGGPAPAADRPSVLAPATNEVALISEAIPQVGQTFAVNVYMRANGDLQAVSIPVVWNDQVIEFVHMQVRDFMNDQVRPGIVLQPKPGVIDAAMLGLGQVGIAGQGSLAILTFRVLGFGDPELTLASMKGRDSQNQNVAVSEMTISGVDDPGLPPRMTTLHQNAPNPFNPMTEISFEIAQAGRVRVRIYSVNGALVKTLLDEDLSPGSYDRIWNGKDRNGLQVASGTYLLRLESGGTVQSKRMMLLK